MIEKNILQFQNDLIVWDATFIKLIGIKHGLLINQSITEQLENSSFVFVVSKSGRITIDKIPYRINTNYLFHVASDKCIIIEAQNTEVEYFIATYHAARLADAGREIIEQISKRDPFKQCWGCRMREPFFFSSHFMRMADLLHDKTVLTRIELTAAFYNIIHRFYSECIHNREAALDIDYFTYTSRYLQNNFAETVSIQNLADALGIARSTLHEHFRRECGISPQQYLMQLRLDAACKALKQTSLSIDEIAASCGLRDKTYFSRVFKTKFETTPGKYRMQAVGNLKQNFLPISNGSVNTENSVLIKNMGRQHRFYSIPNRVVCLDYSSVEMCVALGVVDKICGVAPAEGCLADCDKKYRGIIAGIPFISAQNASGLPDFSVVCSYNPDLVIGTGYSFHHFKGIADADEFEQKGIHVYATIASYTPCCGFESIYEDLQNLGRIFGCESQASVLINQMVEKANKLKELTARNNPHIRVFVFDCAIADKALTSGQTIESYMIRAAGGMNIFENRESLFTSVDWGEVAAADPQVILLHCLHSAEDGRQKIAFLKRVQEIVNTSAIQNNRFIPIGIKKVFPSIDCVDTACQWFETFCNIN